MKKGQNTVLWRPWLITHAIGIGAGIITLFFTATANAGYEANLVWSLIASLLAGVLGALWPDRIRAQKAPFPGANQPMVKMLLAIWARTLFLPLALAIPHLLFSLVTPPCEPASSTLLFLEMPVASTLLAGGLGLLCGTLTRGAKRSVSLYFLVYLSALGATAARLIDGPAMFATNPFIGVFFATVYQRSLHLTVDLLWLRLYHSAILAVLIGLGAQLIEPAKLKLNLVHLRKPQPWVHLLLLLTLFGVPHKVHQRFISQMTRSRLQTLLPVTANAPHLRFHFFDGISPTAKKNFINDALFSLHQITCRLKTDARGPYHIYVFKTDNARQKALGISDTSVARPWKKETYVVYQRPPHYTLRHELTHLVAANFGKGPFKIAAKGGVFPIGALTEGVAEATEGPSHSLTLDQQSAAMNALNKLPSINQLSSVTFYTLHTGRSYVAAASLVNYIIDHFGAHQFAKLYGGAPIKDVLHITPTQLEQQWHQHLHETGFPQSLRQALEARYQQKGVLERRCVHRVQQGLDRATNLERRFHCDRATALRKELETISGNDPTVTLSNLVGAARCGDLTADSISRYLTNNNDRAPRMMAQELALDARARAGDDTATLKNAYQQLANQLLGASNQRRAIVKAMLVQYRDPVSRALFDALGPVPANDGPSGTAVALLVAQFNKRHPKKPLGAYLLARQLENAQLPAEALRTIDSIPQNITAALPPLLTREWLLMKGRCAITLKKWSMAKKVFSTIKNDAQNPAGIRQLASDQLDRVSFLSSLSADR